MPAASPKPGASPRPNALYLIDGSNYIFRAYFALVRSGRPDQSTYLSTSKGLPTGALLVFSNMLMKLYMEHRPRYAAVVFDSSARTFRDEMYEGYKASRKEAPDDLRPQFPYFPRIIEGFSLPLLKVDGVEADDVIATLAMQARASGLEVCIWSGDKDLLQLVGDGICMVDTLRGVEYTPKEVTEKFGVPPEKVGDVLALMGDSIDDIPGVTGIGPGWATKLIDKWGSIEAVLEAATRGEIKGKIGEILRNESERKNALLSRRLVSLKTDVAGLPSIDELARRELDKDKLGALFRELEFGKLAARLDATAFIDREHFDTILDEAALAELVTACKAAGELALSIEGSSLEASRAALLGIALGAPGVRAAYIPLGHRYLGAPAQLPIERVLAALRPLLEDPAFPMYAHDQKYEIGLLARHGIELRGVRCDTMIAAYLLDPSRASPTLEALSSDLLGHQMMAVSEVCGKGREAKAFEEIEVKAATRCAAEDAEVTLQLGRLLHRRVAEAGMEKLLAEVELPLGHVLAKMERAGILLDGPYLRSLADSTGHKLHALEQEIQGMAGFPINVNSPKQLQELLFERLGLKKGRKTKTGASTDADVLEELALEHPVVGKILEYREISKLKGTYLDALPRLCDAQGRIHTSYSQTVAATGRLSSSDPNLQNIPIRTDLGRQIRRAFIAPPGHLLLSADYSQIELRVLAHTSGDPILRDAFARGEDIHTRTAAEVFAVPTGEVTAEMRRIAKAINYGLSYGQTDFGLARVLRIPREEARAYIERYFERYAVLRDAMERQIAEARRTGSVATLLGRRRPLPGLAARNFQDRAYAERMARNTPIQGTAADILKLAMLRIDAALAQEALPAQMLLTVHDELVFEVEEAAAPALGALVKRDMEEVVELDVPLQVDVGIARTWAEAH